MIRLAASSLALVLSGALALAQGTASPQNAPQNAPTTGVSDPSGTAGTAAPPIPQPQAGGQAGSQAGAPARTSPSAPPSSTASTSPAAQSGSQATALGGAPGPLSFYQGTDRDMTASKLLGVDAYNAQNETVGEVQDVILDANRQVKAYVLGVGGVLGVGQRYVALEPGAVQLQRQPDGELRAVVNASRDDLRNAPEFKYEGPFKP